MTPPTYPLRPMNGGRFETAAPRLGLWSAEPKYNDMRVWLHSPTGAMWNRHLEPVSLMVSKRFQQAADTVTEYWEKDRDADDPHTQCPEWLDCLALGTRTNLGKMLEGVGRLLVIDYLVEGVVTQYYRGLHLAGTLPITPIDIDPVMIPLVSSVQHLNPDMETWERLQEVNRKFKVELFEGLVIKRDDGIYQRQMISADKETPNWIKHRFIRG